MTNKIGLAPAALVVAMALWASSFIALKYAFMSYDPMQVIFGRMLIAFLFAIIVFPKTLKNLKLEKTDIEYLMLMALFEPCLYFIFEAEALTYTSAAQAGMITALFPIMVVLGSWIWINEKINAKIIIGGILAFSGSIWMSLGGEISAQTPNPIYGNTMEFLAMVTAVGYTLVLKKLSSKFGALFLTTFQAFIGSIFFLPFVWFGEATIPSHLPLYPTLSILYLGVVVSFGAYGLYNYGVGHMAASKASIYVNLIPIFAVTLAYLILDEKFGWNEIIGSATILTGVLIAQYKQTTRQ